MKIGLPQITLTLGQKIISLHQPDTESGPETPKFCLRKIKIWIRKNKF